MSEATVKSEDLEMVLRELADIKHALSESTIVAFTDGKGKITYVNDQFCRISKYSQEELIGQDHRIINSRFHSEDFFTQLWKTIRSGEIWRGEIRNRAKDGSIYWVSTTIVPFLDKSGEPYQYVAIRYDITAQKEFELELVEQRELIEQTYDAIYIWNLDDGLIYWNKNAESLYGYGIDEVAGREVYDVLRTVYPVSFDEYFAELKREGIWEGEITQTTKDRKEIIVESRQVVTIGEGGYPIVLETSRDITDQRVATERIKQQASLLEKTRDAIIVCDLNHKVIFWNRGAEKLYGWKPKETLGKDICEVICGGEQTIIDKALKALESADEWQEEAVNFTNDSKRINVISRWTMVRNEFDQPDYFLIINTDISELKQTEQQLLRAQRLESIGTLAGGIAHDLNNALSPIMMAADMLHSDTDLPESAKQWVSIIRENTERGADLIKQVLMFARGSGEGTRVNLQPQHLIKEFAQVLQKTFPQDINVECSLNDDLHTISADPTQIHQVLMNLAVNSKDSMSESGGTLKIKAKNIFLDDHFAQVNPAATQGNFVLLTVSDAGVGMSAEVLDRIWDPFFTTKEIGKGTGLGLSTAFSIVEDHGGFINAASQPGKGTTISVYLPAIEQEPTENAEAELHSYPQGRGELILIIDDEADILLMTTVTLESNGYKVVAAKDGTEALAVYTQKEKVDLVITDMAMPFMDGPATIRALLKINPELKIIAASGLQNAYQRKIEGLKIEEFLSKPFTAETLLNTVADVLGTDS